MESADLGDDLERVLLTQEQLHTRLDELAAQIDTDYAGRDLLLVGVLKGAVMVMAAGSASLVQSWHPSFSQKLVWPSLRLSPSV